MIVIGIDPGIGTTGCAVLENDKNKITLLSHYCIRTPTKSPHGKRLQLIYDEINSILKKHKPHQASLETIFFSRNVTTAFTVGQARGVIQLALQKHKIPVFEYAPVKVKSAITGYGHAQKGQISRMVKHILKLKKTLTPDDVADAAAIALTHCFSYKMNRKQI